MKNLLSPAAVFLAAALLFASSACSSSQNHEKTNDTASTVQKQNTEKSSDNGDGNQNNSDSGSTSGKPNGDTGNSQSDSGQNENNPPSNQEVISKAVSALHTNVPVLMPSKISTNKDKYLTAVTKSETYYYEITLIQAGKQIPVNSSQLKTYPADWNIVSLSGTEYKNSTEAAKQIKNYQQVTQQNSDLGYGIKGLKDGAAGHAYITWNEGRWYIRIDSPTDPAYSNSGDQGEKIAKSVVAYLHGHMLPPPHQHGVITIDNWKKHHSVTIRYQNNTEIYTVTSHQEPLAPIKIAVALKPV